GDFDLKEEDWKSVFEELLTGIRLIVVVKFPSVVEGVAVNKFIDKILNFKPKFLLLSGVPGSMIHRTSEPALLYLWSRCDWTKCHNITALGCRHISNEQKDTNMEVEINYSPDSANQISVHDKTREMEDLKEVILEEPVNSPVPVQNLQVSRDLKCESVMVDTVKLPTVFEQDSSHFALGLQSCSQTESNNQNQLNASYT
ncbi:hypothetical protein FRX31_033751, partial [Thalictrum thalictroides]